MPEARGTNRLQFGLKIGTELECGTLMKNDNKRLVNRIIIKLTAAIISSSTAFKPSEPLRDMVPDARRRSWFLVA